MNEEKERVKDATNDEPILSMVKQRKAHGERKNQKIGQKEIKKNIKSGKRRKSLKGCIRNIKSQIIEPLDA